MRTFRAVVSFEPWHAREWVVTLLRAGDDIEDWQARPPRPEQELDLDSLMQRIPVLAPVDEIEHPASALATIRWVEWDSDSGWFPDDLDDMLPQTLPLTDASHIVWLLSRWLEHYERTGDAGESITCDWANDVSGHHAAFPIEGDQVEVRWRHLDGTYGDEPPSEAELSAYAAQRAAEAVGFDMVTEEMEDKFAAQQALEEEARDLLHERDGWFTPEGEWIVTREE